MMNDAESILNAWTCSAHVLQCRLTVQLCGVCTVNHCFWKPDFLCICRRNFLHRALTLNQ